MNKIIGLPVILIALAGCASGTAPVNPTSAKADGAAFMNGLPLPARPFAEYCQAQLRQKLGGTVYLVAAPSLQNGDLGTPSNAAAPTNPTTVVYDQVKDGKVMTGSSTCTPQSQGRSAAPSNSQ
jgi:hypothetical protein